MAMTVKKFRAEVQRRRGERRRGAPRYPDAMRDFAIAHGRSALASGGRMYQVSEALGLSQMTLSKWMSVASDSGHLRRVAVVASAVKKTEQAQATATTLTTSSGHVVTGLSVSQLAELLRALQ